MKLLCLFGDGYRLYPIQQKLAVMRSKLAFLFGISAHLPGADSSKLHDVYYHSMLAYAALRVVTCQHSPQCILLYNTACSSSRHIVHCGDTISA